MAQVDIHNPPPGGFQSGAWYWDPSIGQARQYFNGSFGSGTTINNPGQVGYGSVVSPEVQRQSGYIASSSGGGSGSSSQNPLQQVNSAIQDSFQKLQDEVTAKWGQYTGGNPFNVDQVLADKTKQAKEQIDPYYDQQLGDYLLGVQRKMDRGTSDTKDLLSELSSSASSYTTTAQNNLEKATHTAEQGFADSGLANSGAALNYEGSAQQSTGQDMADYMRKNTLQAKQVTQGNQRNIEDLNLGSNQYQTNLAQNRYTDTSTLAGNLTKEAGQKYIQGFESTLPPSLQSASGFDMLKSLGIYS